MDKTEQVVYQGTAVASDSDTKGLLYDWLQFREINSEDEDKFLVYYRRNLDMYYPKYLLLLEDELTEIPELINYKREITSQLRNYGSITDEIIRSIDRENQRTDNLTSTTDMTRKDTGTIGNVETDTLVGTTRNDNQLNQNTTASSTSDTSDSTTSHTVGSSDTEGHDDSRGMVRQLPQSTEYAAGGFPSTLDWSTGTSQAQDKADTTTHGENDTTTESDSNGETTTSSQSNVTNTGYTTGSSNQTNNYNKTQTNNTQSKDEGTVQNTGTQTINEGLDEASSNTRRLDDKHDSFVTQKGFYGMSEVEIRRIVWGFISKSIALEWFLSKMEVCFIGVFE